MRPGLAQAILVPRLYRHEALPMGPTWETVGRMLAATGGDDPASIRDHAILLLLSVYGVRSGEVRHLRLDDIDWSRNRIRFVRSKSGRHEETPLVARVGNAIARYLREARPQSASRVVFLRLRAPYSFAVHRLVAWYREGADVQIDLDIEDFFGSVDWGHLRSFLDRRVRDGVIRRAIGKWLNAGVMEAGKLSYPERGTPQGGVVSPTLSNVYLHEVLDQWFEHEVKPRLRGRAFEVRYADDAVLVFEHEDDARRVLGVLAKRLEKYGLRLHPDKTRMVEFCRPSKSQRGGSQREHSFAMLGFTHYWGRSRKGRWVVKRKTAKDRFSRALRGFDQWCRNHRHWKLRDQQAALSRKLRGHYAYYGITGNAQALGRLRYEVERRWRKWLGRRSRSGRMSWERFSRLLNTYPLPPVRVVHSVYR